MTDTAVDESARGTIGASRALAWLLVITGAAGLLA
ncbi:vitamin K epoxide reductase family protein, partial [Streptomyces sp. NPDC001774]